MICFKKHTLAILFLLNSTLNTLYSSQEKPSQKPTNYIALAACAATSYGLVRLMFLSEKNLEKNNPNFYCGLLAAKIAAAAWIGSKVYSYTSTLENFKRWPKYGVLLIQEQITDYKLLCATHNHIKSTRELQAFSDLFLELQHRCAQSLENCFSEFENIGFQICDDETLEMIGKLRIEVEQINTLKVCLNADIVMTFSKTHRSIVPLLESLLICVGNLKIYSLSTNKIDIHENCMRIAHFFERKLQKNEQLFAQALEHCKRIDALTTAGHIIHGAGLYAQWRLGEWWQGKDF